MIDINATITLISTTVAIGGLWGLYRGLKDYRNSQELRKEELHQQQRALALETGNIISFD